LNKFYNATLFYVIPDLEKLKLLKNKKMSDEQSNQAQLPPTNAIQVSSLRQFDSWFESPFLYWQGGYEIGLTPQISRV